MFSNKRFMFAVVLPLFALTVLFTACGTSTNTGSASTPTPTATAWATAMPSAVATPASAPMVKTASAMVNGKSVTILTNEKGWTLYYYKPDTSTSVKCTSTCIKNWPPLTFTGSGTPSSSSSLPGTLSVINGANGEQIEYQGHPLYTFKGDTKIGETNGEGKSGVWYVATTTLTSISSSTTPSPTPTSSSYGY